MELKRVLLRKLVKHGYWGRRHTCFDNLPKGFPSHLHKKVKKVAKELIKDNILLKKPTAYGREVSLNPRMVKESQRPLPNGRGLGSAGSPTQALSRGFRKEEKPPDGTYPGMFR